MYTLKEFSAPEAPLIRQLLIHLLAIGLWASSANAGLPVNTQHSDYAIHGYDTVAYFTEGKPVKGNDQFVAEYNGAQWAFSSAENKTLFENDPGKYAPQFGGYCAFAAAHNALSDVDPAAWHIIDGKLYLNYSQRVEFMWLGNLSSNLEKAESYWSTLGE